MARNKYPENTIKLILDTAERLFLEKGYDATSIQDIIGGLGGLSKGAVYHHFKSKEEIFNAVSARYNQQVVEELRQARDDAACTGLEKLKKMFALSLADADRDMVYTVSPDMMKNPRLLVTQLREIFYDVVPHYVRPVIEAGIQDGSIKTDDPEELSEMLILLTNIWLNPSVIEADVATMARRVRFLDKALRGMGIELLDEPMIESYARYCEAYQKHK